jgi:hypothetical protein
LRRFASPIVHTPLLKLYPYTDVFHKASLLPYAIQKLTRKTFCTSSQQSQIPNSFQQLNIKLKPPNKFWKAKPQQNITLLKDFLLIAEL